MDGRNVAQFPPVGSPDEATKPWASCSLWGWILRIANSVLCSSSISPLPGPRNVSQLRFPPAGNDERTLVLPDEVIGKTAVWYQGKDEQNPYTKAGEFEHWKAQVAARAKSNPNLIVALCGALAGPLTKIQNDGRRSQDDAERKTTHEPELLALVHILKRRTLACWCAPKLCHGEILIPRIRRESGNPTTKPDMRP